MRSPRAIVLDIEGTTTDKRFVTGTLFPYARERLPRFLQSATPEVEQALQQLRLPPEEAAQLLQAWIDQDVKREPLKTLQGLIWEAGYADGSLVSPVYPDVPLALQRWRARGATLAVYSSGSAHAQRLLFGHTTAGDLRPFFTAHFDLAIGSKLEPSSYLAISETLGLAPSEVAFYSDLAAEVLAAREAGLRVAIVERDGPVATEPSVRHVTDFSGEP